MIKGGGGIVSYSRGGDELSGLARNNSLMGEINGCTRIPAYGTRRNTCRPATLVFFSMSILSGTLRQGSV